MLPHEFSLPQYLRAKVEKTVAKFQGRLGAELDLALTDLPELSKVERAHIILQRWSEFPALEELAENLDSLLSKVFEGFVVPDLTARHRNLLAAKHMLIELSSLHEASTLSKAARDSLYESDSRIEVVRGHLSSAALRLDWCLNTWLVISGPIETRSEGIRKNLESAVDHIIQSAKVGDFFFEFEVDS